MRLLDLNIRLMIVVYGYCGYNTRLPPCKFSCSKALEGNILKPIRCVQWSAKLTIGIALTDTFSTEIFLKDFTEDLASKCSGVRQDSGDPIAFIPRIVRHYKEHNVNPKDKTIVFSDSLNVERCLELKKWADKHGIRSSFGVGTFLTSTITHPFAR